MKRYIIPKSSIAFSLPFFLLFTFSSCHSSDSPPANGKIEMVSLDSMKYDTIPFGKGVLADLKDTLHNFFGMNLGFQPIELHYIELDDYYLHKFTNEPTSNLKSDTIKFLLGLDKEKHKVICFDTNNDGKFEGESFYDLDKYIPSIPVKNLRCVVDGKYEKRTFYILPRRGDYMIKCKNNIGIDNLTMFDVPYFPYGHFKIDSENYTIATYNFSAEQLYKGEYCFIIIGKSDYQTNGFNHNSLKYHIGDTIYLGNTILRINNVSLTGNRIYLETLGKQNKMYGVEKGAYSFPIKSIDILSKKMCSTEGTNQYLLLDFWGTWCAPCRESLSGLKEINDLFANKGFSIISVAKDKSIDTVRKYLQDENISWPNFFDNYENPAINNKYHIEAYPTFILVDPSGKILYRTVGKDSLSMIKEILMRKL